MPQKELSEEQFFWSSFPKDTPAQVFEQIEEVLPNVLPKRGEVYSKIANLNYAIRAFEKVIEERPISDRYMDGTCGFVHNKKCFENK